MPGRRDRAGPPGRDRAGPPDETAPGRRDETALGRRDERAPGMRAFVVTGPRRSEVAEVEEPQPSPGQVVVDIDRVGVCGTDVEFFTGEMAYLHQGHARYPMRLGHEWCGTVRAAGDGVGQDWLGRRVTGDTMLGCGRCERCRGGRAHVCESRYEVGIRGGFPGALAERMAVPVTALRSLPDAVDEVAGALVEPGGSALRCLWGAGLAPGQRVLVLGPGTIGLLVALFALADGAEVHVVGVSEPSLQFARTLGVHGAWMASDLPRLGFDAIVDASTSPDVPALALDLVEPGGRVVYIGVAGLAERHRHPGAGAQGRHRRGPPRRLGRPGARDRAVRGRVGRPAPAGRGDRGPGRGGRGAGRLAAARLRPRAQGPRGPPRLTSSPHFLAAETAEPV